MGVRHLFCPGQRSRDPSMAGKGSGCGRGSLHLVPLEGIASLPKGTEEWPSVSLQVSTCKILVVTQGHS